MAEITTIKTPSMEYTYKSSTYETSQKITIHNEDGTDATYKTGTSDFTKIIFNNMAKYATEDDPNISAEEVFKLIEDVTLDCMADYNNRYYDTGSASAGNFCGATAGKNAYLEIFNNFVNIYTNDQYSEGGKDITPNEQNKIIESFVKNGNWQEVETEETKETKETKENNNTKENESGFSFFSWLKGLFEF